MSEEITLDINSENNDNSLRTKENLEKLLDKVKTREIAHKDCRELNKTLDKVLKFSTLIMSTITTYFINSHSEKEDSNYIVDRILAFTTTVLSGCHTMFNNNLKAEEHHKVCRNYFQLKSEIETCISLKDYDRDFYTSSVNSFQTIHGNSLGLFPHIRKRHGL